MAHLNQACIADRQNVGKISCSKFGNNLLHKNKLADTLPFKNVPKIFDFVICSHPKILECNSGKHFTP